jgi:DNA-binding MarR family transcriptional regulator
MATRGSRASAEGDGRSRVVEVDLEPLMAASRVITAAVVQSLATVSGTVTVPQLRVLVMLSGARLNMTAVANGLGVNASNASRTCDQLVKLGLVDRQVDPHDRRQASLALTKSGKRLVDDVMSHRQRILASVVAEMPAAGQRRLVQALSEFSAASARIELTEPTQTSGRRASEAAQEQKGPRHHDGDLARWVT